MFVDNAAVKKIDEVVEDYAERTTVVTNNFNFNS
jgi:hypothetical protein